MLQKLKKVTTEAWVWYVCVILTAAVLMPLFLNVISWTRVSGSSMNPTLEDGDRYIATAVTNLHAGDIVIADSRAIDVTIIKRVIGVPGDTIAITDGIVYRNGIPQQEAYIAEPMVTQDIASVTLGEDMYFLMGDNRNNSLDSRKIGLVSRDEIRYVVHVQQPIMVAVWLAGSIGLGCLCLKLADVETGCIMKLLPKRREKAEANA